jgi:multiple sugar transport system permease protein
VNRLRSYAFIAPTVSVFALVAFWPILLASWLSLRRIVLVFHEDHFVGVDNYRALFSDPRFFSALGHTLYFTVVSVTLELLIGLPIALLLRRTFRGRALVRAAILVPWALPSVVSARMWAWLLNPDYGLVTRLLPGTDHDFLGMPGSAMIAAIVADVWRSTPFVTILLLAGLAAIPDEIYRAARVDGARPWRIFVSITLPLLRPAIIVTTLFRSLDALRVFDTIFVLTGGGPANTTETLSIYAYKTMMHSGDFGYGSTLAVATFTVVGALAAFYLTTIGRSAVVGEERA